MRTGDGTRRPAPSARRGGGVGGWGGGGGGGGLPARGFVEAGLPDGAVEQAQRGRQGAQGGGIGGGSGGGGVAAAAVGGAVQHPGEHLASLGQAVPARDLEADAAPFGGGQGHADQRQAVPLPVREVPGQRGDQGVDDVGQGVLAALRERGVD